MRVEFPQPLCQLSVAKETGTVIIDVVEDLLDSAAQLVAGVKKLEHLFEERLETPRVDVGDLGFKQLFLQSEVEESQLLRRCESIGSQVMMSSTNVAHAY